MSPESLSLKQDLGRVALGDRAAFSRVYAATSAHLFGVALRIVRTTDIAEDVLQEAFVNVWHHAGSYHAEASQPMTWLISIVRNKALDHRRSSGRQAVTPLDHEDAGADALQDPGDGPLQLLARAADAMQIRRCLDGLASSQRQTLALAFYQGLSHSEIAQHLDAPLGSVKSWVRRGLEQIKHCLGAAA